MTHARALKTLKKDSEALIADKQNFSRIITMALQYHQYADQLYKWEIMLNSGNGAGVTITITSEQALSNNVMAAFNNSIKKNIKKYCKNNEMIFSFTINYSTISQCSDFRDITQDNIDQFVMNIIKNKLGKIPVDDLIRLKDAAISKLDKRHIILRHFTSIIFIEELRSNFSVSTDENTLTMLTSFSFKECISKIIEEINIISEKINNIRTNFLNQASQKQKKYNMLTTKSIDLKPETSLFGGDENNFNTALMIIQNSKLKFKIFRESDLPALSEKLSFLMRMLPLYQEMTEYFGSALLQYDHVLSKIDILENAYDKSKKLLTNIPTDEQVLLLGDQCFLENLPKDECCSSIRNFFNENKKALKENHAVYNDITRDLVCEINEINEIFSQYKIKQENSVKITDLNSDDNKSADNTLITTTAVITTTPLTFFSDSTDYSSIPTLSTTAEYKELAKEKIARENTRELKHKQRAIDLTDILTPQSAINVMLPEDNKYRVTIASDGDSRQVEIYPLSENAHHLYLIYEGDILPADKFKEFQQVALLGKTLTHDSLGQNGIKIYGLDCMIVKCKRYSAEHLIFVAHPIQNTAYDYVYVPVEIIPHAKYEKLIKDEKTLKEYANHERRKTTVTHLNNNDLSFERNSISMNKI